MNETLPAADRLPPLHRDAAFLGMTATQFLGAFNDNVFKQLVLLLCTDHWAQGGGDYQAIAQGLFALPFVLFSGFCGALADRVSKRKLIVAAKVAEVLVMGLGVLAFTAGAMGPGAQLAFLFAVLFLMGTHSTFFGPAKYGILPEMLRARDLPLANGIVQMTTFLAIIFGLAFAGYAKEWFHDRLWIVSAFTIAIAAVGTLTSLLVRRTPAAQPRLAFSLATFVVTPDTWKVIVRDRSLRGALLVSSLFWFIGGVVLPTVNAVGKHQLELGDARTSVLATCMGIGIALGCAVAGRASGAEVRFGLVTLGSWGMAASLLAFAAAAASGLELPRAAPGGAPTPLADLVLPATVGDGVLRVLLVFLGLFAGIFIVPLQVFLQARPPVEQKGRMIGAMNLVNWIGIFLAAIFYEAAQRLCDGAGIPPSAMFALLALLVVPVGLFYRPQSALLG